jgi:hypothetical protein
MAQLPLNTFKTKTAILGNNTGTGATVYTAPIGVTAIVLMAQISNVDPSGADHKLSFIHHRNKQVLQDAQGNGRQAGNTDSYLVKDFVIPVNDAGTPLVGKMIVESLDSIRAYADTTSTLQLVLSVLETANN